MSNQDIEYLFELYKKIMFNNFKRMYPRIKELGLYPGQPEVLKIIAENDGITQAELSHLTNREAATITRAIQRLETNGYIKRVADDLDKRKMHLYISDKGKKQIEKVRLLMEDATKFIFEELDTEEIKFLIGILEKIQTKFNNEGNEEDVTIKEYKEEL